MTLPLLGGGGELVGSGKFGTPCPRMHLARVRNCSFRLSASLLDPLLPGPSLAHACWADLNAGDWVSMSLGMKSPPVALGSGKLGTPLARMHWAYLSSGPPLGSAPLDWLEDPQAATSTAHITTAITEGRRRVLAEWRELGGCMSLGCFTCSRFELVLARV
jgi:hypothetical protein